jgi:hypothetical protein
MEIKTVKELITYLQDNFAGNASIHQLQEDINNRGEIIEMKIYTSMFIKCDDNSLHIDFDGLV